MAMQAVTLIERITQKLANGKIPSIMEQAIFKSSKETLMSAQMKLKVGESIRKVLPSGTTVTVTQVHEGVFEKMVTRASDGRTFKSVFCPNQFYIGSAHTLEDIGNAHKIKFRRGNFDDFYLDGYIGRAHVSGGRNNGLLSLKINDTVIDTESSQKVLDSLKANTKVTGEELRRINPSLLA
ncbi:MAG: hypothetical protein MJ237_01810 [bacterium]|nr:hypothetical protein [bacterium]